MDTDCCTAVSTPTKHARGPGDDEDYQTPERPEQVGKRVKWDRGLASTVILDEIEVRGPDPQRLAPAHESRRKSCLAKDMKAISLDQLGNLVDADGPLDLVAERVVVTKFVYDNDEEPQADPQPTVKQTRSRAKRNR
ncbi:hypothetical protein BD410DRAFT_762426 [Rickenella mellea]|uniref:Uncharacterized protein n=1 Tax=Rickenella mellea TaxID=50990 RepID=A0A4Y7QJD1_9AGAM|nr:hypothetical protein BD410DRAFT_762426 [Rickenella mellea]